MKKKYNMGKKGLLFIMLGCMPLAGYSQPTPDLLDELSVDDGKPIPVLNTFKDTRLINFHTVETRGKGVLDYRISHRFGEVNTGIDNLYGFDGGASIRMGLEYSFTDNLMVGFGRGNVGKLADAFVKYKVLHQTEKNEMPISLALLGTTSYSMLKDPGNILFKDDAVNRLSYVAQVMVARKFSKSLTVQVSPTFVHYNLVDFSTDKNDIIVVPVLARYSYTSRQAITFEYAPRLTGIDADLYGDNDRFRNSLSVGWEVETGGHVFAVHFSNAFGFNEIQTTGQTMGRWADGGVRIGFNIVRSFTLVK